MGKSDLETNRSGQLAFNRSACQPVDNGLSAVTSITYCLLYEMLGSEAKRTTFAQWIRGKRVLDIASGSVGSTTIIEWMPNFARYCSQHGAQVTALDINRQYGADACLFEWAAVDLVHQVTIGLNRVPVLQGKTFDFIYSNNFVGDNPAPDLIRRLGSRNSLQLFEATLLDQAADLLSAGGYLFFGEMTAEGWYIIYQKVGNELKRVARPS